MTTVLNIQADESTMRLMDWILSEVGFDVVNALGAPPATFAHPHRPDIVIVNTNMSQDEKCACILALHGLLPSVMILDLSVGAELDSYDTGADQYLNKPFTADDLILRVQACAPRSRRSGQRSLGTLVVGGPALRQTRAGGSIAQRAQQQSRTRLA